MSKGQHVDKTQTGEKRHIARERAILKRTLTGIVSAAILIGFMYTPDLCVNYALFIVCATGALEMLDAFSFSGANPARVPLYAAICLAMPLLYIFGRDSIIILIVVIIAGGVLNLVGRSHAAWQDAAAPLYIALTTIIPALLLTLIGATPIIGRLLVFNSFTIPLMGDTFALFIGSAFGKHKLTSLSPKKTIEGAVGGLIGSVVGALLFGYMVGGLLLHIDTPPVWQFILLGLVGGVLGQIGDLSSSLVKRHTGIKDFGALFPGHGGIMDRLDSTLFTAYSIYIYTLIIR